LGAHVFLRMAVLLYPGGRAAKLDPAAHQTAPGRFDRFGVSVENDDPGAGGYLGDREITPRNRSQTMFLETPAPFLRPERQRLNGRAQEVLVEHVAGSGGLRIALEFLQDLRMCARLEAIDRRVSPRRAVIAPFADDAEFARMLKKTVDARGDDHVQVQEECGSAQISQGARERAEFLPEAFPLRRGLPDRGQWPRLHLGLETVGVICKTDKSVGLDQVPPDHSPQAVHITGIVACAPLHADDVNHGTVLRCIRQLIWNFAGDTTLSAGLSGLICLVGDLGQTRIERLANLATLG